MKARRTSLALLSLLLTQCALTPDPQSAAPGGEVIVETPESTWELESPKVSRNYSFPIVGEAFRGDGFYWVTGAITVNNAGFGSSPVVWRRPEAGGAWEQFQLPDLPSVNHMDEFRRPGGMSANGRFTLAAYALRETGLGKFGFVQLLFVNLTDRTFIGGLYDDTRQIGFNSWVIGDEAITLNSSYAGDFTLTSFDSAQATMNVATGTSNGNRVATVPIPTGARSFAIYGLSPLGRICRIDGLAQDTQVGSSIRCGPATPPYLEEQVGSVLTSAGPRWLWKGRGRTFAVDVTPMGHLDIVDLGLGSPALEDRLLRPKFGKLVPFKTAESSTPLWLDLAADGLFEVALPQTPCVSDASCLDRSTLEFAMPLEAGAWFVLHGFNRHDPASGAQYVLTGRKVTPARTPRLVPGSPVPPPSSAPIPEHPEAVAASPLVVACEAMASCTQGYRARENCIQQYGRMQGGTDATDTPFQALLTSATRGCVALSRVYTLVYLDVPCAVGSCRTDQECVPTTSGGYCAPGPGPWTCETCDAQGNATPCSGTNRVSIVSPCATRGQSCSLVSGSPTCTMGSCVTDLDGGGACQGDKAITGCVGGFVVGAEDCARSGQVCRGASCIAPALSDACTEECIGDNAVFCVGGLRHFVDCAAQGWGTCRQASASEAALCTGVPR